MIFTDNPPFGTYRIYNASGTQVAASASAATVYPFSYAAFGTPTTTRMYIADGQNNYRLTTSSITTLGSLAARHVCQTQDGRLAYGGFSHNTGLIYFSDPGDPEVIPANNQVTVSPGDGEQMTGMVSFREHMFVFKETKFFVFYGTSFDSTNEPIFNFRPINAGIGAIDTGVGLPSNVCVGRDGVYFTDGRAIYRTTGGEPVRISRPIDAFLQQESLPFFGVGNLSGFPQAQRKIRLRWANDRLYVIFTPFGSVSSPTGMFVWDALTDYWTWWSTPFTDLIPSRPPSALTSTSFDEQLLATVPSAAQVVKFGAAATSDAGASISSRLVSGFMDFGSPGVEKVIGETQITGTGTVNFGWARDFGTTATSTAVSMGPSTTPARGLHRVAQRGETLGYRLTGSGQWQINRLVPMIRSLRGAGERTS